MAADRCANLLDRYLKVVPAEKVPDFQSAREFFAQQSSLPDVRSTFSVRPQVTAFSMGSPPSTDVVSSSEVVPEQKGEAGSNEDVSDKRDQRLYLMRGSYLFVLFLTKIPCSWMCSVSRYNKCSSLDVIVVNLIVC